MSAPNPPSGPPRSASSSHPREDLEEGRARHEELLSDQAISEQDQCAAGACACRARCITSAEDLAREEELAGTDDARHVVAVDELELTDADEQQARHLLACRDDDLAGSERTHGEASDDLLPRRVPAA